MIKTFIKRFDAKRDELREHFRKAHPDDYTDIVTQVIKLVTDEYRGPDPNRIHVVDDGDYQGTLVFVIAAKGYQPSYYWFVKVGYGSCSGCDTLEAIRDSEWDELPTEKQVEGYFELALHVVQGLRPMGNGDDDES